MLHDKTSRAHRKTHLQRQFDVLCDNFNVDVASCPLHFVSFVYQYIKVFKLFLLPCILYL